MPHRRRREVGQWRKWPWRDIGAVALLIALTALFYWRYLTPNELDRVYFPRGDFTDQFYVYRSFAFNELRAGRFPRWIPCVFSGYPYQADPQSSLFYLPNLLNLAAFLAMGWGHFPLRALEFEAVTHVLLAGLFTYAFLRVSLKRRLAALLGAVVFAFGGYLTGYPPLQLAILESAVWLPLALLGVHQWHRPSTTLRLSSGQGSGHRTGRWLYGLVTALAFAMSILAGHPQTYTQVIYTTLAFGIYLAWRDRAPWRTALVRLAGPVALAVGLSAVQLIPSFEYARLSTRAQIPFAEAGTGFPLQDIVQFVLTGLVSHWQPLYVGIFPLGLAIFAVFAGRQRDTWFWAGLAVVALALSFGANLAAFDLAYLSLPGYSLFRSQERHAFLVSFALGVLAAYGADVLFGPLPARIRSWVAGWRRLMAWGVLAVGALLIGVVVLARYGIDPSDSGALPRHVAALLMWVAGSAAVLQARLARPRKRILVAGAALALVVLDLFTLNRPINYAERYDLYPATPVLRPLLADDGRFRIQDDYRLRGHTACAHGLEEVWGIEPIRPAHYDTFMQRAPENVRWQLLGVRYVVSWRQELFPRPGKPAAPSQIIFQQGEGQDTDYVHRLPGDRPWAWVVRDVQVAQNIDDLYRQLGNPDFDPYRTAVLWKPVDVRSADVRDSVQIVERQPSRLVIDAELGAPGLVVISEITYPGWQAFVDGEATRIYEADGVLRAVRVPAGAHRIEMRFNPRSFKLGAAISALSLAGLLALIVIGLGTSYVRSRSPISNLQSPFSILQSPSSNLHPPFSILLLVLVAFGLRTAGLAGPPLNGDEAFTVLFADHGWAGMLEAMRTTEPNPPLHSFALRAWMAVAGRGEFSVRFLSAMAGLLVVPLTYVLGRRLLGARVGLAAALLAAVNPYLVWYSHFARAYSLYLTLSLASLVLALHFGFRTANPQCNRTSDGCRWSWWAYVGVTALALYTHYFAFLFLIAQNLIFLVSNWRHINSKSEIPNPKSGWGHINSKSQIRNPKSDRPWRTWFGAQAAVAVLVAPWLILAGPMLLHHKKAWLTYVSPAAGLWRALGAYSLGVDAHGPLALLMTLLFAAVLTVGVVVVRKRSRRALIVLGIYLFAPLAVVLLGSLLRPIFLERYLIGVVPALLVLVAAGVVGIPDSACLPARQGFRLPAGKAGISNLRNTQHAIRSALAAAMLIALVASASVAAPFGADFADWRGVARALEARVSANDVVVQNYPDPALAYYYRAAAERTVLPAEVPIPRQATDQTLRALLREHERLWLLPNRDPAWDADGFVRSWLDRRAERVIDEWVAGHHLLVYRQLSEPEPKIEHRLDWRLDDVTRLVGYRLDAERIAPGEPIKLTLFWEPLRTTDVSYTVFVHLWDGQTIWGQKDGQPQACPEPCRRAGAWPTTEWFPGDLIVDSRQIPVDPEVPAGKHQLIAGLYRLDTGERLPVFDAEGRPRGDYVPVTEVHVEP